MPKDKSKIESSSVAYKAVDKIELIDLTQQLSTPTCSLYHPQERKGRAKMRKLIHGERLVSKGKRKKEQKIQVMQRLSLSTSHKQTCPQLYNAIPQYLKTSLSSVFIPEHDNL